MALILWTGFVGANLAAHPRLLADTQGTESRNQRPGAGDLRPWKSPLQILSVTAGKGTIYRFGRDTRSDSSHWMTFDGQVSLMRGFDAEDPSELTYALGPQGPKWFNSTMLGLNGQAPDTMRDLAVPAPTVAPTATITTVGNAGTEETWNYLYTFVNDQGWESAPSPVSGDITVKTGGTQVTLSGMSAAPAGNYGIVARRIYRTKTGTSGSASFFLLREVPIGTSTTIDAGETLEETLATLGWLPMPAGAHHLTALWNGLAVVLAGKSVRVCEPYSPYAWPLRYEIVLEHTAVACAAFQQSLIVGTTGQPYLITGLDPDLSPMKLEIEQACASAASMTSVGHGAVWASPDGLVYTGVGGTKMLTAGLIRREDWQNLNPSAMVGAYHDGLYFCLYPGGGFVIDPANPTGLYFFDSTFTAMHVDTVQDALFLLDGANIRKWNAAPTSLQAQSTSKSWVAQVPCSFACADIIGDGPATVTIYGDGAALTTQTISMGDVMRIPSDSTYREWKIRAQTSGTVQAVRMAQSVRELSGA